MKDQKQINEESDSTFLMKIVLYFILGAVWIRLGDSSGGFAIPVGLVIGLVFASHDHFQIDRKMEYVVLLISAILSFFVPSGILI